MVLIGEGVLAIFIGVIATLVALIIYDKFKLKSRQIDYKIACLKKAVDDYPFEVDHPNRDVAYMNFHNIIKQVVLNLNEQGHKQAAEECQDVIQLFSTHRSDHFRKLEFQNAYTGERQKLLNVQSEASYIINTMRPSFKSLLYRWIDGLFRN